MMRATGVARAMKTGMMGSIWSMEEKKEILVRGVTDAYKGNRPAPPPLFSVVIFFNHWFENVTFGFPCHFSAALIILAGQGTPPLNGEGSLGGGGVHP